MVKGIGGVLGGWVFMVYRAHERTIGAKVEGLTSQGWRGTGLVDLGFSVHVF